MVIVHKVTIMCIVIIDINACIYTYFIHMQMELNLNPWSTASVYIPVHDI